MSSEIVVVPEVQTRVIEIAVPGSRGPKGADGAPGSDGVDGAPGPRGQSAVQPEVTLTSNATVQAGTFYRLNSKAGSFDVTLPADPVDGARVTLAGKGWETHPVKVQPNGRLIDGSPLPLQLTDSSRDVTMEFDADLNSWSY